MTEVVFLHGFLGAETQYAPVERALASRGVRASFKGVTLPGHGLAPAFVPSTSDSAMAAAADLVASTLGATTRRARVLLGYSMGARLGLALLQRHPGAFDAAVLIGAHPGYAFGPEKQARIAVERDRLEALRSGSLERFVDGWEREPVFSTQARALDAPTLDAQRAARLAHTKDGIAWALEQLSVGAQPVVDVREIDAPIHFLAGALDPKFARVALELSALSPRFRSTVVDGAGHNLLLEAPDAVARALAQTIHDLTTRPEIAASNLLHPDHRTPTSDEAS